MENLNSEINEERTKKSKLFLKKLESNMHFDSDYTGGLLSFDWLDEIEKSCPFIDIIVRIPKFALIKEEEVVKIEKAKKITVSSVKDLTKHANYINKINKKDKSVEPKKILESRNEETYNIYENRFLYTLIDEIAKFIAKKEKLLNDFEIKDNKTFEYDASTSTSDEKVKIQLKITSESIPTSKVDDSIKEELKSIKERLKRVKEYLVSWQRSEMVKALDEEHVSLIKPPIKKTNLILKNPNFRVAVSLWEYLYNHNNDDSNEEKDNLDNNGNDVLKGFVDHSFLIDYFVMDSITNYKREQKKNMSKYAIVLLTEEIRRVVSLLLSCGYKITDEELLNMIAKEINREKNNRLIGVNDVKRKFKNALDEYLERVQDYL